MTLESNILDCIIVGHNDSDFNAMAEDLRGTQTYSGAFGDLKNNSVVFRGERMPYMKLLNKAYGLARGKQPGFDVCTVPHLGAAILKTFLRQRNFQVEIVNSFNSEKEQLIELLAQSPRVVAITTTLYVENGPIVEIVDFVRRHNPDTKIIVGGPHIFNLFSTQEPKTLAYIFESIGADVYIFDSQGELTLSLILEELRGLGDLSHVPNLAYTDDGKSFQFTKRVVESNEIDKTAVNWDYFDRDFYTPTVQIRTARSCAFSCAFCKYPALAGPLNLASLEVIEQQLRYLDSAGVSNVVFIDDTFNVPLPRFKEICRLMIKNKFSFNWFSFFRCSNSDEEAFDLMARSRCKAVFLGIESGDPTVLKKMNKFADVNRYKQGIRMLKERDITTFASIIVGFPGETEATIRNTIDFLGETSPTFYRAELYYHYTNVPIHEQADKLGIRGAGYSWKHNTMTWQEAAEHVKVMLKTIEGPTILPGYMFDFWSIPYLLGKNLSFDQIKGFTGLCHQMVVTDLDGAPHDSGRYEKELVSLFSPV